MKRIFNFALALYFFTFSATSAEFTLPEYEKFQLKNGLTVYLLEQHEVPLIDVAITVKAGAVLDTKAGLAQITADNLLLGTKKLSKNELEEALEFVGAEVGSGSNLELTRLTASFASKDLNEVLPLLADTVLKPAFSNKEFEKNKTLYLATLEQQQERPSSVIKQYFDAMLYQGHPYANQVTGNLDSVSSISLDDIKAFHSKWYTPGNSALVITGSFEPKVIKRKVKKLFGKWRGKSETVNIARINIKPQASKVLLVNKSDATETRLYVGGLGIEKSNPDSTAISVINTILGGRFSSWLNDALRISSGLTYGAGSRFDSKAVGGSFYISTFTDTENTKETMDSMLRTYARLWQQGIDQATLDSAKAYVKGRYPPRFETSSSLARLLSDMFVYEYDEQQINTFSERVDELDLEKTKTLINTYFPKERLQFTVIGKAEAIKGILESYGTVQTAEITESTIGFD